MLNNQTHPQEYYDAQFLYLFKLSAVI